MLNYVFVDIETTSLDPNKGEIIEISCLDINGKILLDEKVSFDYQKAEKKALEVNMFHKRASAWDNSISQSEMAERVGKIFKKRNTVLVAHNVDFEKRWLGHHCGIKFYRTFCTKSFYYIFLENEIQSSKLSEFRLFLGLSSDNAHTSLKDARDCLTLFNTFKNITIERLSEIKNSFYCHSAK